eukprot:gene27212-biopygen17750
MSRGVFATGIELESKQLRFQLD